MINDLVWLEFVYIKSDWVWWTAGLLQIWLVKVTAGTPPSSVHLRSRLPQAALPDNPAGKL